MKELIKGHMSRSIQMVTAAARFHLIREDRATAMMRSEEEDISRRSKRSTGTIRNFFKGGDLVYGKQSFPARTLSLLTPKRTESHKKSHWSKSASSETHDQPQDSCASTSTVTYHLPKPDASKMAGSGFTVQVPDLNAEESCKEVSIKVAAWVSKGEGASETQETQEPPAPLKGVCSLSALPEHSKTPHASAAVI